MLIRMTEAFTESGEPVNFEWLTQTFNDLLWKVFNMHFEKEFNIVVDKLVKHK